MPDVHAHPLPTGALSLDAGSSAHASASDAAAPYPAFLQMLPLALLFVVFVLCVFRLVTGAIHRSPLLARLVARIAPASVVACAMALACILFLGFISPLASRQPLSGAAFNLFLLAGAVALCTVPLAWREGLRRLARIATDSEVRAVSTRRRIAWLCAISGTSAVAASQARLHQPPVSPFYGVLQFAFLAIFLLTLFPALDRLKGVFRRPNAPPPSSP